MLLGAAPAQAAREIPVGVYNVNNSPLTQGPSRIYATRFVLDRPARIFRFYSGMNWEGVYADGSGPAPGEIRSTQMRKSYPLPAAPTNLSADWTPGSGRPDYAHGTGGTIRAALVPMRPDGSPDLGHVLAEETYPALERYRQLKAEFAFDGRSGLVYSQFGGVALPAGVPHFVTYQNVDADPRNNFVSLNSPTISEQAAGPNGRNTLDPNAGGAIAGLDPREAVAWSLDGGANWGWGSAVGGGPVPGDYTMPGDDAVRLPWYAWQESAGGAVQSNQPFYAYEETGSYTVRLRSAPRATTLTEAGGYAPQGREVGIVTVRNLRTGAVGTTGHLGTGMARGPLSPAIEVAAGDSYEISNSGTVAKAEGDLFLQKMGLVGPGKTPYETVGNEYDRAELFALPHPWFDAAAASAPPPASTAAPRVFVRKARVVRKRKARAPSRANARRLRLVGGIAHARRVARRRVVAKALVRGRWRVIARSRVRRGGRFRVTGTTRLGSRRRGVRVKAVVRGVGRSRAVRVRLR